MFHEVISRSSSPARHQPDAPGIASPGSRPNRILLVDANGVDAERYVQELERARFEVCRWMASSALELAELCLEEPYDAIVCDDATRERMSMKALELIRQRDPDMPFIALIDTPDVSGITQEDLLTGFMLRGATDCVDKKHLSMLPVAVAFAIEQRVLSEERNRIDQELERSRARYQAFSVIEDVATQSDAEAHLR